jgi:hypothetical protein
MATVLRSRSPQRTDRRPPAQARRSRPADYVGQVPARSPNGPTIEWKLVQALGGAGRFRFVATQRAASANSSRRQDTAVRSRKPRWACNPRAIVNQTIGCRKTTWKLPKAAAAKRSAINPSMPAFQARQTASAPIQTNAPTARTPPEQRARRAYCGTRSWEPRPVSGEID